MRVSASARKGGVVPGKLLWPPFFAALSSGRSMSVACLVAKRSAMLGILRMPMLVLAVRSPQCHLPQTRFYLLVPRRHASPSPPAQGYEMRALVFTAK